MDREGFKFDLLTQRFIVNRWDTELGQRVREEVCEGLKNSVEVRAILSLYVLDHRSNIEPYGYPYYPLDAMESGKFWILTPDDLRGIRFYNEDFSRSLSFEKKSLTYASFYNCNLSEADLTMTDLSYARLEKCKLLRTVLAMSGGFSTQFIDCDMREVCLWQSGFIDSSFLGSDLRGAFFEDAYLKGLAVNHLSKFDTDLVDRWRNRIMPPRQRPDILRAIRIGYQNAEVWEEADRFLFAERTEKRKHLLRSSWQETHRRREFLAWLWDMISAAV